MLPELEVWKRAVGKSGQASADFLLLGPYGKSFKGRLSHSWSTLPSSYKTAVEDDTPTGGPGSVPIKVYFQRLKFEFHVIFLCHGITFRCIFNYLKMPRLFFALKRSLSMEYQ